MKYLLILISTLLLASCGVKKTTTYNSRNSIYKKWELSVLHGNRIELMPNIYIEFAKGNKITGFTGCNRLTGTYIIENKNKIKIKKLGITRMACNEKVMELEHKFIEMLDSVDNFTLENDNLKLNIGQKTQVAEFYAMNDNEIINKYCKLKKLEGQDVIMKENQEREQYFILRSDGTFTGFAGCNYFNGSFKLEDLNRIKFNENIAVTMKLCPDVSIDEKKFLKVFELAENYSIHGDILSLYNDKKVPLAIFEIVYF